MKPEQQSLYNEQYLRTRLERILAATSKIENQETWNIKRAQALLLTPPWMFAFEEQEEYQVEIQNLSSFEQKLVAEIEKRNITEPSRWRENEQFDNLLLIYLRNCLTSFYKCDVQTCLTNLDLFLG